MRLESYEMREDHTLERLAGAEIYRKLQHRRCNGLADNNLAKFHRRFPKKLKELQSSISNKESLIYEKRQFSEAKNLRITIHRASRREVCLHSDSCKSNFSISPAKSLRGRSSNKRGNFLSSSSATKESNLSSSIKFADEGPSSAKVIDRAKFTSFSAKKNTQVYDID
jgi:hypothetical protein